MIFSKFSKFYSFLTTFFVKRGDEHVDFDSPRSSDSASFLVDPQVGTHEPQEHSNRDAVQTASEDPLQSSTPFSASGTIQRTEFFELSPR